MMDKYLLNQSLLQRRPESECIQWYRSLNPHRRIMLKQNCLAICGIEWSARFFTMKETIQLIYGENK